MIDKVRKTIEMSAMMMNSGRSGGGGGGMPDQSQIALDVARSAVRLAEESAAGLADANTVLARMREEKSGLEERVAHLERMDRYHDGGSTPGSHNTVTQQRIAGERKKQKEKKKKPEPAKGGPQKGHKGAGRAWRPEETITCRLDKCTSCGCTALEVVRQYEKMLILLELGIVSIKAYHVHEYTCAGCGAAMSDKPDEMLDGTTISRSLLVKLVRLHRSNKSMSELCETAEIAWGVRLSRAAVSNGIRVAAALLRPEEDRIREAMGRAKAGNPDETRLPIGNDLGYLWACIADKLWVLYHAATSRKRSVLWEMGINPEMKVTSDAYSAYKFFKVLQLCWAHVKTKVKNAAVKIGTPVMKYLYGNLMAIHRHATTLPPDTPQEVIDGMIRAVRRIGRHLLDRGAKDAGTYVINCAENLFTAVRHPEMTFTNNPAETLIRPVVIRRKVIYRFATLEGARRYCTIASCLATWKLQDKDPEAELMRLFSCK